ncbi:MAG TPA: hotdog fold thioesterase [Ornithinimicrobium sp.]|uniref:PaaI family thioesterase n=1 Tax=Ornithinimicrobium sp. TaxID=1977084 RepID=UPI002B4A82F3|nr:hotdog fold thioesterase [Ornithinimicrobium sp.]HKJ11849.1 hotdog fold thioesterase [Ornithinimicrobium sp.]
MADSHPASASTSDLAEMSRGTLIDRLGIEVISATADRVVGTMPTEGNTQPYGLLHGGASVVLAETLGSVAAGLHAGPTRAAVGVDINATHHKAVRPPEVVTGVASALRLGGAIASYEIVISDESGDRVCTCRLTCALRDRPPAASD